VLNSTIRQGPTPQFRRADASAHHCVGRSMTACDRPIMV
jgi:hypothetical protein